MKWTWKRLEVKVERTFLDMKAYVDKRADMAGEAFYKKAMAQLNIIKKSEQIKHNGHERRLQALEQIHKEEIEEVYQKNLDQELRAAEEADKV